MCSRNACTVAHTAQPRRWCSTWLDSHHGLSTSTATCSIRFRRFADSPCQRRVLTMVEMRCVVKKRGVPTYSFAHREGAACPFSVGFRVGFRTRISLRGMKPALHVIPQRVSQRDGQVRSLGVRVDTRVLQVSRKYLCRCPERAFAIAHQRDKG